jgi:hypothetical protein
VRTNPPERPVLPWPSFLSVIGISTTLGSMVFSALAFGGWFRFYSLIALTTAVTFFGLALSYAPTSRTIGTFSSVIGFLNSSASNQCGWSMIVEHTGPDGRGPSPRPASRPFLGCWSKSQLIQIFDNEDTSAAWPRAGSLKACSMVRSRV